MVGGDGFDDVEILDRLDGVRCRDQTRIDTRECFWSKSESERPTAGIDAACARVLAQHEPCARRAD